MRKLLFILCGFFLIALISGCELNDENIKDIGGKLDDSLVTLKGNNSVILHFEVEYNNDLIEYDIYINKAKEYSGLHIYQENEKADFRYIIYDKELKKDFYYEYDTYYHTFGKTIALDKTDYVYDKLCFDEYDIPSISLSIEEIIKMVEEDKVSLNLITNDEEELKNYNLYDISLNLSYFIENNPTVLVGLFGKKINEENYDSINDIIQKIVLGYDKETGLFKYFAYDQNSVIEAVNSNNNISIKVTVIGSGEVAVDMMTELEQSDIFPNEDNTK